MTMTPEELLKFVVKTADDRQAQDIMALDMKGLSVMSDYNVVTHASNSRLIKAIGNSMVEEAEKTGIEVTNIEGKQGGSWVLIDLGAVIFHVFDQEEREHYNLESLWTEAESVDISEWITD